MGLFRRDRGDEPTAGPQSANGDIEGMESPVPIEELEQIVVESLNEAPIERETLELLQVGLPYLVQHECSDGAVIAGQTAARLGYLARAAEFALFEGDLEFDDDLLATLSARLDEAGEETPDGDVMADLAAELARSESLDPSPYEGGPSWTLPGLAGSARGTLRDGLVARMRCPPDVEVDDLRRTWKYGYFLHALDELFED